MATENKSASEQDVRKQVEFYFSNSNLPRDKFLLGLTKENDGWVSIEKISTFKKMQALKADVAGIVQALRSSKELVVNEAGTMVKRTSDIPDKINDLLTSATIYAKGFATDATVEAIEKVFTPHGTVKCVRLRRYKDKSQQKDSAFIEFGSPEEAKAVAAMKIVSPVAGKGDLLLLMKADYHLKKGVEAQQRRADRDSKKKPGKKTESKESKEEPLEVKLDLILKFTGLADGTTREDIKAFVGKFDAKAHFVDYSKGKADGFVRLQEDSAIKAAEFVKKAAGQELNKAVATISALTGDEEQEYWKTIQAARNNKSKKGGKPGKGGGRGGRGGGRGGKGGNRGGGAGQGRGKGKKRKDGGEGDGDAAAADDAKPEQAKPKKVKLDSGE